MTKKLSRDQELLRRLNRGDFDRRKQSNSVIEAKVLLIIALVLVACLIAMV